MNILITGASKGIGYQAVLQFAANKSNKIIAVARNITLLKKLRAECVEKFENQITIFQIDFTSTTLIEDLHTIFSEYPIHFDIVINNAGYLINKPFIDCSLQDIEEVYAINIYGPIQLIKSVIQHANPKSKCHIVNIGSMGGYQGSVKFPGLSLYSSSKAALANLTECLAEEYKNSKIVFNCLALGSVQTEMLSKAFPDYKAQLSPIQIAIYLYNFCLTGSDFFNGKIIPISKTTP